jgi:hypothetical protein
MNAGLEFLFWLLVFGLVGGMWAIMEIVERKKKPDSPWMKSFRNRQP